MWGSFPTELQALWEKVEWPCEVPHLGSRRSVDASVDLQRVRYLNSLLNTKTCIRPGGMSVLWLERCGPAACLVHAALLQGFRVWGLPRSLKWVEFAYLQKPGRDPGNVDAWRDIAKVFPLALLYSYDVLVQGQCIALANAHSCLGGASLNTGYFSGVPTNEMAHWMSVFVQGLAPDDFTFTDLDYANCYPSSNYQSARGIADVEGMPDWWVHRYMELLQGFTQYCKLGDYSCSEVMERGYLQGLATSTIGAQLDHAPLSRLLAAAGIGVLYRKLHVPMVGICDDGRVFYSWSVRARVHKILGFWHSALHRRVRPDKGAEAVPSGLQLSVKPSDRMVYDSEVVFSKSGSPTVDECSVKFQHESKCPYPVMGGIPWAYTDGVLSVMWDRETRVLAQNVTALFAHSVVRRFRIRAFDVVVLPKFLHRMQFYPFTFKQLRQLDSVQRSVHLHSFNLPTTTARSALMITSGYVSISDRADINLAASLVGMLGSRMVEHRRAAVYHLAKWLDQFGVVSELDNPDRHNAVPTVFGAYATQMPSSSNAHQFVPVVMSSGSPTPYISKGQSCSRRKMWPWGAVFSVLAQAGVSLQSDSVSAAVSTGCSLSSALDSIADSFRLGSFRDFRLVTVDGGRIQFSKLASKFSGLVMSARKSRASAKFTLNDKPRHPPKAAPLMLKLFSRLKMFSDYASSVHMLDLARVDAWSHLSARTSPISAPCSFCGKNQPQTTAHCLASGACTEFQKLKIDRHDEVSRALQRFLKTRTAYHHMATVGSVINPAMFQSNSFIKHTKPDVFAQDPESGDTIMFDVTVVMPQRMAHAYSEKQTRYTPLSDMVVDQAAHALPSVNLVVKPTGCVVLPVVFSVFGDLYDESFLDLKDLVSDGATSAIAPFLAASCKAIAVCASAVASASARKYACNRRVA